MFAEIDRGGCDDELANIPKINETGNTENMPIRVPLHNINCSVTPFPSVKQITSCWPLPLEVGPTEGLLPFHSIKIMKVVVALFSRSGMEGKQARPQNIYACCGPVSSDDPPQAKVSVWPCNAAREPSSSCTHRRPCGGRELLVAVGWGLRMG